MSKNVIIFEIEYEQDRSNEINDFNNSSSNDEECSSNIPNILPNDPKNIDEFFDVITRSKNFNDIAYWPEQLTSTDKDYLITTGPKMSIDYMKNFNFSKNNNNRSFSYSLFFRTIRNREKYLRKWIFNPTSRSNLSKDGLKDWKHVNEYLKTHENSPHHIKCASMWLETNIRLKENKSIDAGLQKQIVAEREHWKKVLERLIEITIFLGKNNLAFRDSCPWALGFPIFMEYLKAGFSS
ncbi:zinc finger MYM-type protein 5-like [Metopolophium dirhodum]|uniref:zinc finger MYM-type protein 5-like n=1 Tax=Metopolophium dirhodum TaxID=44670 RepID=UPI00298FBFF0|nr:zinc finger MYM-type protein 5-like [Metopolophium dirhodum]